MKKIITLIILALALSVVSCGNKDEVSLEAKKRRLQNKKNELRELSKEVASLEAEVQQLDPSLRAKAKVSPVVIEELKAQPFKHYVEVQGMVEANQNITVSPMVSGRITRIYVREGQYVKANQVLAQIDDAVLKSNVEEVKTQLKLAEIVYEKQKRLWDQEIGTEIQYLTAKNNKESLESRLATLKEQLSMNRMQAPISGTVDEIYPKVGELTSPGAPAFRIVNARDLSIVAEVPEAYAPYISKGKSVNVDFPILNKNVEGKITTVGQSINPTNRSFKVEVKLPNSKEFKPNMFGEISINDRTLENAITIPLNIIQKTDEGSFVFVAKRKEEKWIARRVNISMGLLAEESAEITKGLEAGDKLITTGYKDLSDGQEVSFEESIASK